MSWLKVQFNYRKLELVSDGVEVWDRRRTRYGEQAKQPILGFVLPLQSLNLEDVPLSAQVLVARLRDNGWCPHRILNGCYSLNYATLYYLSSLNRRAPAHVTHDYCSTSACVANKHVIESAGHSHRTDDCNCSVIGPDMGAVKEIIKSGGIPLMQLTRSSNGDSELKVVRCAPYSRYTAISHVVSTS